MNDKLPPIHPGEILREEFLKPMGLSQSKLAIALHVSARRVRDLVHGRRNITVDSAASLAKFFGTTPEFWLNLQMRYDLEKFAGDGLSDFGSR
jgi:addiction module HigA family antidote